MADQPANTVDLATSLTIAWLNNPNVRPNGEDVTAFLQSMHSTLTGFAERAPNENSNASRDTSETSDNNGPAEAVPAVSVRKSLASRDRIISLIDGKPYSALKRHLTRHGLTPQQYRERFGLKPDYPMVAPAYAEKRRELAKKIGLGRKPGMRRAAAGAQKRAAAASGAKKRGRPPKAKG